MGVTVRTGGSTKFDIDIIFYVLQKYMSDPTNACALKMKKKLQHASRSFSQFHWNFQSSPSTSCSQALTLVLDSPWRIAPFPLLAHRINIPRIGTLIHMIERTIEHSFAIKQISWTDHGVSIDFLCSLLFDIFSFCLSPVMSISK